MPDKHEDGLLLPRKLSFASAALIVGLCVQAGIAEYRLREAERDLREASSKLQGLQDRYLEDSSNWQDSLRKIDKYLCKICLTQVKDGCGVCDD